jgi:hypothetical protein
MMNFRMLTYIETLPTLVRLPQHVRDGAFKEGFCEVDRVAKSWTAAKNLVSKVRKSILSEERTRAEFDEAGTVDEAWIEELKPNAGIDWRAVEVSSTPFHRFHLPLVSNPGNMLYAGGEGIIAPVGMLIWINHRVMHSAVNFGAHPRYHLIIDMRRAEP